MSLWNEWGVFLEGYFGEIIKDMEKNLVRRGSEFETMQQHIEYVAKRDVLLEMIKMLSKRYD